MREKFRTKYIPAFKGLLVIRFQLRYKHLNAATKQIGKFNKAQNFFDKIRNFSRCFDQKRKKFFHSNITRLSLGANVPTESIAAEGRSEIVITL